MPLSARRSKELKQVKSLLVAGRKALGSDAANKVSISSQPMYMDTFKSQRAPTIQELLQEYKGVVYACAMLNAQAIANTPLKLYVKTTPEQKACRWPVRGLQGFERKALELRSNKAHVSCEDENVEEVLDHPLLDLLHNPNEHYGAYDLLELTALYMELGGKSYWRIEADALLIPKRIWLMQSHLVTPIRNMETQLIKGFRYGAGTGGPSGQNLDRNEVIDMYMPNPLNPYGDGWGPTQGAWEAVAIMDKDKSHQLAMLDNKARPDFIVSPKTEEAGMGSPQATRLEAILKMKFAKGRAGGPLVSETPLDVIPLNFSSADMELLQRYGVNKTEILNQFLIPPALMDSMRSRAELEAALVQHGRQCVNPRLKRRDERLTQLLCPMYDERLFLASDDACPEDAERQRSLDNLDLNAATTTINRVRQARGLLPVLWGDAPWMASGLVQPQVPGALVPATPPAPPPGSIEALLAGAGGAPGGPGGPPKPGGFGGGGKPSPFPPKPGAPVPESAPGEGPKEEYEALAQEKAVRSVLRTLRKAGRMLPIDELAVEAGVPLSAVGKAIDTLTDLGLVVKGQEGFTQGEDPEWPPGDDADTVGKGSASSGNHGHSGRPGLVGGSGEGGSAREFAQDHRISTQNAQTLFGIAGHSGLKPEALHEAMKDYSEFGFETGNLAMRHGKKPDYLTGLLVKAAATNTLPDGITLHRGFQSEELYQKIDGGAKVISDKALMSFSSSKAQAKQFISTIYTGDSDGDPKKSKIMLELETRKTPGFKLINSQSSVEREYIVAPGRLTIKSKEKFGSVLKVKVAYAK